MEFHYDYVIESQKDHSLYKGCTKNLVQRLKEHNKGAVDATRSKRPWKLIYYEACIDTDDAYEREKYLKSGWGRKYIKERLKNYYKNLKS